MRIVIINKSDATGGASVVSFRLMEALRREGADARMLVAEKLSDSPYVEKAASSFSIMFHFLWERLRIFFANGFNQATLFKIDTGLSGLPLWHHPLVKGADAILLNWVNQGMLSLRGVARLSALGKPVIWTMHDMWCFTGVCHHAARCRHYRQECGECPLLGKKAAPHDLSHKVLRKKSSLYALLGADRLRFVAVSRWLQSKAAQSSLLANREVTVIPNAFNLEGKCHERNPLDENATVRILFGAARIDDPIKGVEVLKEMSAILKRDYPSLASRMEIVMFGEVKNPDSIVGFSLPVVLLGTLHGSEVRKAYESASILVSASSYETLPGTLVEAQAFGCIPVSFSQGGQPDIVTHLSDGFLAEWHEQPQKAAEALAQGVVWASGILADKEAYPQILVRMRENVKNKFSYKNVASRYLNLIGNL